MAIEHVMAMNNLGVSLLKSGQFSDACIAMREALTALKICFNQGLTPMEKLQGTRSAHGNIAQKLSHKVSSSAHKFEVNVLYFGDTAVPCMSHLLRNGQDSYQVYPLCVDDDQVDSDLLSAITLYNFGLACYCVHVDSVTNGEARVELLQQSTTFFRLSREIMSNVYQQLIEASDSSNLMLLYLMGLVSRASVGALQEAGDIEEIVTTYRRIKAIEEEIDRVELSMDSCIRYVNAAAA